MYQYLEANKPFIISTFVGIMIIMLFGIDKPCFENRVTVEEKTVLLYLKIVQFGYSVALNNCYVTNKKAF